MNNNKIIEEFIERGAELEHMRWARWQKYLHSKCQVGQYGVVIPRELYDRWERQIEIPYDELSELEKESDKKETRNYLPLVESLLLSQRQEIVKSLEGMNPLPFVSRLYQNQNRLEYCGTCEQAWEMCSCSARNTGYKKALSAAISI